ncbi:MAG: aldo/keto reductase, partial [Clostridia bacterium]|nr:aldo/keto reductase [Clostridia bacterium]
MSDYLGKDIFKLGFGLMRLPKNEDESIDVPQTSAMVDEFISAGGTYFDTAFVYTGSEDAIKQALVDRYPRESYTLATKLNAWLGEPYVEAAKQQLNGSLERTGAGYFDFYLLHAIMRNNYETYEKYGLWDFVKEAKEKGVIKHWGFSFHADPAFLDEVLTAHPDAEFVQLQLNYADWENPGTASEKCWEIARKLGKPIVVMEPLKGGALADPIPAVQELLKEAAPDASIVSWGSRYAAGREGGMTVLSGMSSLEQMQENLSYMKDFKPLDAEEMKVIRRVQDALNADKSIP